MKRAALTVGLALLAGCDSKPDPEPQPAAKPEASDIVLDIDGLTFTHGEIETARKAFEKVDPTLGINTLRAQLLSNHFVPIALSRRDHPKRRGELKALAQELHASATNAAELKTLSRNMRFATNTTLTPWGLAPDIVDWAFDHEHLLLTSPVIELPTGFTVFATTGMKPGVTTLTTRVEALTVMFPVFDVGEEYEEWLEASRDGLRGKVRYVHPDYEDAIPNWLR